MALFAFAFVAAPHSCEWGNAAYLWSGVAVLVALCALPFVFRAGASPWTRSGLALCVVILGIAVWLFGLFAANFHLICKLF